MNCTVCGGRLKYKDGLYVCENCKSVQTIDTYFENTEVFIVYTENDELGRRSKDSIIAQDIYNKLTNANINIFYQRSSALEMTSLDFEEVYFKAISEAKIILILACSKENFNKVLSKNGEYIHNKKIIPIYKDMDAYDIPSEISEIQAINYDNVGAITDLERAVLAFLGREKEINIISASEKKRSKKKKIILQAVIIGVIIFIAIALFYILGTDNVLKCKKYDCANKLVQDGQLLHAMDKYTEIYEYKDSAEQLKKIYGKYNGYYENEKSNCQLRVQVLDNANIEITCDYNASYFSVTAPLNVNNAKFDFVDSENKHGNGILRLNNKGIKIYISIPNDTEITAKYTFNDRVDQKTVKYDKELLLSWLSRDISANILKKKGYRLRLIKNIHAYLGSTYSLEDASIKLFSPFDDYIGMLSAPASIMCPEKIGEPACDFLQDGFYYSPYGEFPNSSIFCIEHSTDVSNKTIEKDTIICVTKKDLVDSEYTWDFMVSGINE